MLGDGIAFRFGRPTSSAWSRALESDGEAFAEAAGGAEYEIEDVHRPTRRTCSCRGRTRGPCWSRWRRRDLSGLRYYRFLPEPVRSAACPVSIARCGYSGELGYELYTRAGARRSGCWTR